MGKVSGKTHTKEQLDDWANQHNPNNKAYKANAENCANQTKAHRKTHQRFTTHAAGIKLSFGLTGHPTIRNTMIKN